MTLPEWLKPKQAPPLNEGGFQAAALPEYVRPKQPHTMSTSRQAREEFSIPSWRDVIARQNKNIRESVPETFKGVGEGLAGTYGSLLELSHAQPTKEEEAEITKPKRLREFDTIEKLEKGERPSYGELMDLFSDEDISPALRYPTMQDVEKIVDSMELPGTKKTAQQKGFRRFGQYLGGGMAFGAGGVQIPAAMALVGQTLEEAGAPAPVQAVFEIAAALKMGKTKTPVSSSSPMVEAELKNLRAKGFSERDITIARHAMEDKGWLAKSAKYTREAQERFQETLTKFKDNISKVIEDKFPGLAQEGPEKFKKIASGLFDSLDDVAREVQVKKPSIFINGARGAIDEMERTLAASPAKKEAIQMLKEAIESANKRDVKYNMTTTLDAYNETRNMKTIRLKNKDNVDMGSISYITDASKPDQIKIGMMRVWPEYKHTTAIFNMLEKLVEENPGKKIDTGGLLDEGLKFMEKLLGRKLEKYGGNIIDVEEIKKALDKSSHILERSKPATARADYYTNFYKEMNAVGNWGNPKQRERAFGIVKDAIKKTLRAQGKEGAKVADMLEEANQSWIKYLDSEDVAGLIAKSSDEAGLNINKLHRLLENPSNMEMAERALGVQEAQNLRRLSKTGTTVEAFEKKVKGGFAKEFLSHGTLYAVAKSVVSRDLSALKTVLGVQAYGTFVSKYLTDPKFQNLAKKAIQAFKDNNTQIFSNSISDIFRSLNQE